MKLKEAEIAKKLADASVSFGSCFDTIKGGTGASTRVGVAQKTTIDEVGLQKLKVMMAQGLVRMVF